MAAPSSHMWYVRAAGGVWGPYPEARIAGFVAEGRVRADTLLSPWSGGPFAPAEASAEFAPLFRPAEPAAPAAPPRAIEPPARPPHPRQPVVAPAEAPALVFTGPPRALLIWAEVDGARVEALHIGLAALGRGVTIRPGLWLVQARAGPAAVRNHLSRRLGPQDRLLVVEAPLEQAAWFNLGRDHDLRRLWSAPQGGEPHRRADAG